RSNSRSSRSGRGGTKLLAIRPCRTRSAIHSASFTSVLRPGTLRICRALPTPRIAADLRKRRLKPHTTWHLDEVYLKIDGRMVVGFVGEHETSPFARQH